MAFWQVWGTVRVCISQSHRLCTHNSNRHDIDCPAHHPARKIRKRNSLKLHQYTEPMLTCYLYLVQRLRGSTSCGLLATELAFPPQLLPLFVPPAQRLRLHTLKFKSTLFPLLSWPWHPQKRLRKGSGRKDASASSPTFGTAAIPFSSSFQAIKINTRSTMGVLTGPVCQAQ